MHFKKLLPIAMTIHLVTSTQAAHANPCEDALIGEYEIPPTRELPNDPIYNGERFFRVTKSGDGLEFVLKGDETIKIPLQKLKPEQWEKQLIDKSVLNNSCAFVIGNFGLLAKLPIGTKYKSFEIPDRPSRTITTHTGYILDQAAQGSFTGDIIKGR
jgi:hypothetical protein